MTNFPFTRTPLLVPYTEKNYPRFVQTFCILKMFYHIISYHIYHISFYTIHTRLKFISNIIYKMFSYSYTSYYINFFYSRSLTNIIYTFIQYMRKRTFYILRSAYRIHSICIVDQNSSMHYQPNITNQKVTL